MAVEQTALDHPLAEYGHYRLPHRLWRASPRALGLVARLRDIWLIASGRLTLHHAWQIGFDQGHADEYHRVVCNGGDLGPILREVVDVTFGYANENESVPSTKVSLDLIAKAWARHVNKRAAWMNRDMRHLSTGAPVKPEVTSP